LDLEFLTDDVGRRVAGGLILLFYLFEVMLRPA
jgi:hypothetical protein